MHDLILFELPLFLFNLCIVQVYVTLKLDDSSQLFIYAFRIHLTKCNAYKKGKWWISLVTDEYRNILKSKILYLADQCHSENKNYNNNQEVNT